MLEDFENDNLTTFQAMKMARQKVENEKNSARSNKLKDIMEKRRLSLRENKNGARLSSAARDAYQQHKVSRGFREAKFTSSPISKAISNEPKKIESHYGQEALKK